METIPGRHLARVLGQVTEQLRQLSEYEGIEYSFRGPHGRGIFLSKEMNAQAKYIYLVSEDHSLRGYVYAAPHEDSFERKYPPFMRTYIFTNPACFFIASEGTRGGLRALPWEKEMMTAGIPDAFIKAQRKAVKAAMQSYGT